MEKANNFHSTIKFTAEMSETEITFLDGQYKTWTADCELRTTDCGLGVKRGLGINCRLRTEYKTRTTDYVYKNNFRKR